MNAAPALLGYAATVGWVAPRLMLRGGWPYRSPVLAATVWTALAASFSLCVALSALHLATPGAHLHGILYSCSAALGGSPPGTATMERLGQAASAVVVIAHAASFTFHALRARVARNRHRRILDKVGRPSAGLRATVVEHEVPAAYCLPGLRPRIVVSSGAVERLSRAEIDAVVEHERAHIACRHHLILVAVESFATVFRGLPLARHLREQVPVLLEMAADDRALRHSAHGVLATAMFEMASGGAAPRGALSAGGPTALVRLRRLLAPSRCAHPAFRGIVAAAAVVIPLLPLLLACPPGLTEIPLPTMPEALSGPASGIPVLS
ncbi:M56 family metallopeptidase [Streptomyces sp. NPDC088400]|uniref:M56 family metallopeptidase n=1 Tax=Streptomyces sp. NPDC088400 TaxID=3365861 RepID=UPI00381DCE33